MAEDIVKLISRPDSAIICSFLSPSGDVKYTGVGKICDFRLKSPFISETVRDRLIFAIVARER